MMYGSANLGLWHILANNCSFAIYLGAKLPEGVYSVFEFHQYYFKFDMLTWKFLKNNFQNNSILVSRE